MNPHIIAVLASPRKKHTYQYLKQIEEILNGQGINMEILTLSDYQISFCTGCQSCIYKTSKCWQTDDSEQILNKLKQADGLILAVPVYVMSVPGILKAIIDKTAWWVHRPQLVGKPVLVLATTANSGLKEVQNYLEKVVIQWGMQPAGRIVRKVTDIQIIQKVELQKFSSFVIHQNPNIYKPSLQQILFFQVQKFLANKILPEDLAYWKNQGWAELDYFFPNSINLWQKLIGRLFFIFLNYRIKPVQSWIK